MSTVGSPTGDRTCIAGGQWGVGRGYMTRKLRSGRIVSVVVSMLAAALWANEGNMGARIRRFPRLVKVLISLAVAVASPLAMTGVVHANPGIVVSDLNNGVTTNDLANALVGSGVTVS